jgi:hypothetical protein
MAALHPSPPRPCPLAGMASDLLPGHVHCPAEQLIVDDRLVLEGNVPDLCRKEKGDARRTGGHQSGTLAWPSFPIMNPVLRVVTARANETRTRATR